MIKARAGAAPGAPPALRTAALNGTRKRKPSPLAGDQGPRVLRHARRPDRREHRARVRAHGEPPRGDARLPEDVRRARAQARGVHLGARGRSPLRTRSAPQERALGGIKRRCRSRSVHGSRRATPGCRRRPRPSATTTSSRRVGGAGGGDFPSTARGFFLLPCLGLKSALTAIAPCRFPRAGCPRDAEGGDRREPPVDCAGVHAVGHRRAFEPLLLLVHPGSRDRALTEPCPLRSPGCAGDKRTLPAVPAPVTAANGKRPFAVIVDIEARTALRLPPPDRLALPARATRSSAEPLGCAQGTTTPITFVKNNLFPYARSKLESFLKCVGLAPQRPAPLPPDGTRRRRHRLTSRLVSAPCPGRRGRPQPRRRTWLRSPPPACRPRTPSARPWSTSRPSSTATSRTPC